MNANGIPIHNGRVNLSSNEGQSVYADSAPNPIDDLNGRAGWLYKKSSGTEKFNYYFYSQGSTPLLLKISRSFFAGVCLKETTLKTSPRFFSSSVKSFSEIVLKFSEMS